MSKAYVSKDALTQIIHERMQRFPECPPTLRVEIKRIQLSDGPGWTAITSSDDTLANLQCARIVGALTIELRKQYALLDA